MRVGCLLCIIALTMVGLPSQPRTAATNIYGRINRVVGAQKLHPTVDKYRRINDVLTRDTCEML